MKSTRTFHWGASLAVLALAAASGGARAGIHGDGTLKTTVTHNGGDYTIGGGVLRGSNLFQSFADFSLALGNTATWTYTLKQGSADSIGSIIDRVTGSSPSNISGTINTTAFQHAAFFFINPNGVVFGNGAVVDVPGAVYISTAQTLRFADGKVFHATTATGSRLSMADPTAFGFLGDQKSITFYNTTPAAFAGPLFLAAANIVIDNSTLSAGALDLYAVGDGARSLSLSSPSVDVSMAGGVTLRNSQVTTTPTPGFDGSIAVGAGALTISGPGGLYSTDTADARAGDVNVFAQTLTVTGSMNGGAGAGLARLGSLSRQGGGAGNVTVHAGDISLSKDGNIHSGSVQGADGGAGAVKVIDRGDLSILSGGAISNGVGGEGSHGSVIVRAETIEVAGGNHTHTSRIGSQNVCASAVCAGAQGGNVTVRATGTIAIGERGEIVTSSREGASGEILVKAMGGLVLNGGTISGLSLSKGSLGSAETFGHQTGGLIKIDAPTVDITSGGQIEANSGVDGVANSGTISAGNIIINAGTAGGPGILMIDRGTIASNSYGAGDAGDISVHAGSLTLANKGNIQAEAPKGSTGDAGRVSITTGAFDLADGGFVGDGVGGSGGPGQVKVTADTLWIHGSDGTMVSHIGSRSNCKRHACGTRGGVAGDVTLDVTGLIRLSNGGEITTSSKAKQAGEISVIDPGGGLLINGGTISSSTSGAGATPGGITLDVRSVSVANLVTNAGTLAGLIATNTFGSAPGGNIRIVAPRVDVSAGGAIEANTGGHADRGKVTTNQGSAGTITILAGAPGGGGMVSIREGGVITSDTYSQGDAGDVNVTAGTVKLDDGDIQTQSKKSSIGQAGTINLHTGALDLSHGATVADGVFGTGGPGLVLVRAGSVSVDGTGSRIGSNNTCTLSTCGTVKGQGEAGLISIVAHGSVNVKRGDISTNTQRGQTGQNSGNISVDAKIVSVTNHGSITSNTFGSAPGGDIRITAPRVEVTHHGAIEANTGGYDHATRRTVTNYSGAGGNIYINGGSAGLSGSVIVEHGTISANSDGHGGAGGITLQARLVEVTNQGQVTAISGQHDTAATAGLITISAHDVSVAHHGTIGSNTYGVAPGGDIEITAPTVLVTSSGAVEANTGIKKTDINNNGAGGNITITAGSPGFSGLLVVDHAKISSDTFGVGPAGTVKVTAGSIHLGDGLIQTLAERGSSGAAGTIVADTGMLTIRGGGGIADGIGGTGGPGLVLVTASDISISGTNTAQQSRIASNNFCSGMQCQGDAGEISISATGIVKVTDGGQISTVSTIGQAGTISLTAGSLKIDGIGTIESAGTLAASPSEIISSNKGGGAAGDITVEVNGSAILTDGGAIATNSSGTVAGNVSVTAASLKIGGLGTSDIAGTIVAVPSGISSSDTGGGTAGAIAVNAAGSVLLADGGEINTNSNGSSAGDIGLSANSLTIDGVGFGNSVSQISSTNSGSSASDQAGAITIRTNNALVANGGEITTNANGGNAGAINIIFDQGGLLILKGAVHPGLITTSSQSAYAGKIDVVGATATILDGGGIYATAPLGGAYVTIEGPVIESSDIVNTIDVSGILTIDNKIDLGDVVTIPDVAFDDASKVLQGQCPVLRSLGQTSQFSTHLDGPYGPSELSTSVRPLRVADLCGQS